MEQPKIPTLKDAQKPQVKIKGMGAGLTLFDRLKQFKKKDLAFILAGLGTLFMAPLAEHFMMSPENGDSTLQKGWGGGSGSGSNLFGSGSSPYENGNNSIAQGGAIGGSGDIITPLNVRDPSSLVMGPGGMQQPNAGSMTPPTPPPTAPSSSSEDLKDALAQSASRAASAAVKKAPLPIPKISVGGSGLRGLGVAGGGSSASGGMAPINSGNLGQAGTGGGGLNLVRSSPAFRGAAGPRGNAPQGLDGTKKAGQNAGDAFSRSGSALGGLNAAASEQIPTGGQGFSGGGQGGAGANDKNPGGSGAGGSKSVGESLAFIEAKERMMENLKLEFEKRKLKDPELLMYGIRNEVLKAGALKLGEGLTKWGLCQSLKMGCPPPDDEFDCGVRGTMNASQMTRKCSDGGKDEARVGPDCWLIQGSQAIFQSSTPGGNITCNSTGKGKGGAANPKTEGPGIDQVMAVRNLGATCGLMKVSEPTVGKDGKPVAGTNAIDAYITGKMKPAAQQADIGRVILEGGAVDAKCGATLPPDLNGKSVTGLLAEAKNALSKAVPDAKGTNAPKTEEKGGTLQQMSGLIDKGEDDKTTKELAKTFKAAEDTLTAAEKLIVKAKETVAKALVPPTKEEAGGTIDSGVTANVTSVTRAQEAVRGSARSLAERVAEFKSKIADARRDIGDEQGTGSLHDTVRLNKASSAIKVEAEAKASIDTITAKGPENLKPLLTLLTTSAKTLGTANENLGKFIADRNKNGKEDSGLKANFESARKTADTDLEASRKEQDIVIKGYSDFVDRVETGGVLR